MISQPAVQSTGLPTASGSVPVQSTENWGLLAGVKVATWDIPILFLRSFHPGYIPPGVQPSAPQPDEGPAFTFGSPDGQDSSFFQGVELGARLVSPYAVLPAEISTLLEGFVTLSATVRLRDLFGAFGATKSSAPEQKRTDSPVDGSPTNDKGRKKKKPQQRRQRTSPPATTSARDGQLPKTAVALGALSSLTAAAAASPSGSKTEVPIINVTDATILGKIGNDSAYPLNGTYRQIADINVTGSFRSIGDKSGPFTGDYDGKKHKIYGLDRCLVKNLKGKVRRLHFKDARIETNGTTASTGVAACKMSDANAVISKITVKDSVLVTKGDNASAGIAVGEVNGGTVKNTTAENCNVTTSGSSAYAGIGAGYVLNGKVAHTTAKNCKVNTTSSDAGIGVGRVDKGSVYDTKATDCKVEAPGGNAGIGAGKGVVDKTEAVNCNVTNSGSFGNASIGVGSGKASDTKAINCEIKTSGNEVNAGIGVGSGEATDTKAMNCRIKTFGNESNAGIGAGSDEANNTLAIKCDVKNYGSKGNIGIGVGKGYAKDTTAMNCEVKNFGANIATAGIGAGRGAADKTIAINCTVENSASYASSGIGAGFSPYEPHGVNNTKSFNSTVKSSDASSFAGFGTAYGNVFNTVAVKSGVESGQRNFKNHFGAGPNPTFCDVRVNRAWQKNKRASDCPWQLENFCKDKEIDPILSSRLVESNCQPTHCYSSALSSDTVYGAFEKPCPPEPKTTPNTITMTLPTNAAPLATTLSTGAIASIALGAFAAFVLAGVAYRHCCRRSSPVAAGDPQELVTVNKAGQAQEAVDQPMTEAARREAREQPAGEQRLRIPPPKPPGLSIPGKSPVLARGPFLEEPGDNGVHQHEHIYEEIDIYNPHRMRTAREPDY